jgi:hypothetical protein
VGLGFALVVVGHETAKHEHETANGFTAYAENFNSPVKPPVVASSIARKHALRTFLAAQNELKCSGTS